MLGHHHQADALAKVRVRHWAIGVAAGAVALAALVAGSAFGNVNTTALNPRLVAWISAGVLLVFGVLATSRLSTYLGRTVARRSLPSAGTALRLLSAGVGYLIVLFGVLAVLSVSIGRLLVGAGLAGVVLGIAATQSLGNVVAGVVLVVTRPFSVGDHVRVRSGALGGVFDGWVVEMSLTYTTLRLADGPYKVPNAAMLAAGVGQLPLTGPTPEIAGSAPRAADPEPAGARLSDERDEDTR